MGNRSRHVRPTDGSGPASRAGEGRMEGIQHLKDGKRYSPAVPLRDTEITIGVTKDVKDSLDEQKTTPEESYDSVIRRLLRRDITDSRTGLGNQKAYYDMIMGEVSDFVNVNIIGRIDGPAVIFIDLDKLGEANKRFGHDAGDMLIQIAAMVINSAIRSHSDTRKSDESFITEKGTNGAFRRAEAGDEFLVILPESTLEGVELVIGRIREQSTSEGVRAIIKRLRDEGIKFKEAEERVIEVVSKNGIDLCIGGASIFDRDERLQDALSIRNAVAVVDRLGGLADSRMLEEKKQRKGFVLGRWLEYLS